MFENKKIIIMLTVVLLSVLVIISIIFIINYGALSTYLPNNSTDCPCGNMAYYPIYSK
jgi:hypothetical protein